MNEKRAVERFQAMIRKKTVSAKDGNFDREEFASFLPMLKENYPEVFAVAQVQLINDYGILIHWRGEDSSLNPVVLMAHHDVVSDEGQAWLHPAFEAEIHDDCIWGRGSIDTKCLIAGILEAMDILIEGGFTPKRDIYFASSNCEEVGGDTMPKIVDWFRDKGITPEFVLDEGGAIMSNLPMGIKTPFAMVAVSEKGWATVKLTAKSKNTPHGAKAAAKPDTPAPVKMVRALGRLDKSPMKPVLSSAMEGMLESMAPYVNSPLSFVFKNVKSFSPVIKKVMAGNPDTAAMISSVINIVGVEGASKGGAPSEEVTAELKIRIAPHDSFNSILEHIKREVGEDIEVTVESLSPAPPISEHRTDSFELIKTTIKEVFPDVGVSPFILNAGTDSRHFAKICKKVYRFGAFRLNDELFGTVHGANERMPIKDYIKCIEFYQTLIKKL